MVDSRMRFSLKTLVLVFLLLSVAVGLCVRTYIQKRNETHAFELIDRTQSIVASVCAKMMQYDRNVGMGSNLSSEDTDLKMRWYLVDSKDDIKFLELSFTVAFDAAAFLGVHAEGTERSRHFLAEVRQELEDQKIPFTWDVTIDGKPLLKETK